MKKKVKSHPTTLRLPEDLKKALGDAAKKEYLSRSKYIELVLRKHIDSLNNKL